MSSQESEPRLYQQVAALVKERIENDEYPVGTKLPAERLLADEMKVSRTVIREAIIMLEVEGYVDVRKGSGIHVISNRSNNSVNTETGLEFSRCGPFELLQARQLIESHIAEFAATQATKEDILKLVDIQKHARKEDRFRDSTWDLAFHMQIAASTHNSAMVVIVEQMWSQRLRNPYWLKLHEHIDNRSIESWCDEHDQILQALARRDSKGARQAMWQHLENTKKMLFNATSDDFEFTMDRYFFADSPTMDDNS
ncbi:transcriptional regulator ExuR [Providencia hangzhouensis]|uniref:Transcriptional regulator ExuR n=1 Tax=Providencia rettgeri TaxID=587 RepID=A0AAJ4NIE9_PRORE|nr:MULTISPECIES: transcriptional regulator ExuR [Providencia]MBJ9970153.1 transcriptional regulator ExuR [Providencia rettgeri]MCB6146037.1 transcriptional regulator ExuR [Providencia rettgeri]MCF8962506.1 putative L-lactate dehydrogenase operon regulatory protein [Providencia rettgeri]MDB9566261.1 transcriptional regulator ExuR [Providencia rettgeri]QWQ16412.1 transcriptional regulator ExuR [Providencia rettgeri]